MNPAANIALAILFCSGLYLELSKSWNALYRANIVFHPAVEIPVAIVLMAYYVVHAIDKAGTGPGGQDRKAAALKTAGAALAATAACAAYPPVFLPLAAVGVAAAFFISTKAILAAGLQPYALKPAVRWQVMFFLLALCLFSGAALLPVRGVASHKLFFDVHRWISLALLVSFVLFLLWPLVEKRPPEADEGGSYFRKVAGLLAAMALFGAALYGWMEFEKREKNPSLTFSMSVIPVEKRAPEDQFPTPFSKETATALLATESCASREGCHQDIYEDYSISNHSLSVRTPHFLKNLDLLAEEVGEHNRMICAGCHYPYMMFSGETNLRDEMNQKGFGCVYCHQISAVRMHPTDKRISYVSVEAQTNHLKMFSNPDAPGGVSDFDAMLIKLHPDGHRKVFKRPLYSSDDYCQVCHGLQIVRIESVGFQRNSCVRCHMQPRYYLGRKGYKKNHFFPGANATVAYELGYDEAVKIIQDWARGDFAMDVSAARFWKLRKSNAEMPTSAVWLVMNIVPQEKPERGKPFRFDLVTTNAGIDHQFPSAPLDMVQGWLQVTATDANGAVLYELGKLDHSFRLPKDYPENLILGGYMLDSRDHMLVKNRVWDIKKKVINRNIKPGQTQKDAIEFQVPTGAVGPISVRAQWNYRTHNQDFVEWGFMEDGWSAERPRTAPVSAVGGIEKKFEIR